MNSMLVAEQEETEVTCEFFRRMIVSPHPRLIFVSQTLCLLVSLADFLH
jgi:hypothetical protein